MTYVAIALLVVAILLLEVDRRQTQYIARHPEEFHELNPLLGLHPSVHRVRNYFCVCVLMLDVLAVFVNLQLALIVAAALIALEAGVVVHNYRIGIRMGAN